jgi:hypothetical protein
MIRIETERSRNGRRECISPYNLTLAGTACWAERHKLRCFKSLCGDHSSIGVKTARIIVADPRIRSGLCLTMAFSVLVCVGDGVAPIS